MIILNPLEPWPGELVLDAAATHDVKLITRVVDYGGMFHDDVRAGPHLRRVRPPQVPPRRMGRAGPREARADAPVRRAPRADACCSSRVPGTSRTRRALRGADADPGERPRRAAGRGEARRAGGGRQRDLRSASRRWQRSRAIGQNHGCMALKGASPEHEGEALADRWALDEELSTLAARWRIAPERDLVEQAH